MIARKKCTAKKIALTLLVNTILVIQNRGKKKSDSLSLIILPIDCMYDFEIVVKKENLLPEEE